MSRWWWLEIGLCALSIASTSLLCVLLTRVADTALDSWPYPIQINSVIAILTAISRTAMLVPITACISQLKWRHFERPNRLSHLQDYDSASRGPWGSFLILFNFHLRDLPVRALSLLTILSLGIGPSAQQILEFPSRRMQILNPAALIVQAPAYAAREPFKLLTLSEIPAPDTLFNPPTVGLPFQTKLRTGLLGSPFQPDFSCPPQASECSWDAFRTLGLCADVRNVTADVVVNCTSIKPDPEQQIMICDYAYRDAKFIEPRLWRTTFKNDSRAPLPDIITVSNKHRPVTLNTTVVSVRASSGLLSPTGNIVATTTHQPPSLTQITKSPASVLTSSEPVMSIFSAPAPIQALRRRASVPPVWNISQETLHKSGNSLAIRRRPLQVLDLSSTQPPPIDVFYFGWEWCEKTFKDVLARGGKVHIGSIDTERLRQVELQANIISLYGKDDGNIFIYATNTTPPRRYQIGDASNSRLEQTQGMFFDQEVLERGNSMDGVVDFGMFMYQSDFPALVHNYADTVDNILHQWTANLNATNVTGHAYTSETFIRVRWAWILLPVIESLGPMIMLALSIILTRRQPLVKDSAVALLFYGPDRSDWPGLNSESSCRGGNGDASALAKDAKNLVAALDEDLEGRLRLKINLAK